MTERANDLHSPHSSRTDEKPKNAITPQTLLKFIITANITVNKFYSILVKDGLTSLSIISTGTLTLLTFILPLKFKLLSKCLHYWH